MKLGQQAMEALKAQIDGSLEQGDDLSDDLPNKQITVKDIKYINLEDSTYVYITDENGNVYKQDFAENESLIFIQQGDSIKVFYQEGEDAINQLISYDK